MTFNYKSHFTRNFFIKTKQTKLIVNSLIKIKVFRTLWTNKTKQKFREKQNNCLL